MALQESITLTPRIEPDRALRLGIGAAASAPLWASFLAVAGAGAAYWWMTAWTRRPTTGAAPVLEAPAETKTFAPVERTIEAAAPLTAAVEAPVQAVAETLVEAAAVEAAPAAELAAPSEALVDETVDVAETAIEAAPAGLAEPAPLETTPVEPLHVAPIEAAPAPAPKAARRKASSKA